MADNNKGTVYQQINKFFNLDGFGYTTQNNIVPEKTNKIIIKGNTPEEVYKKGLELEQKKQLQKKFFGATERGFQKAMQYEASRLPAYLDFEGFEYYPIISSALDLFMEEATTLGENGKMLNIYSNKERIKSILEDFFYDVVNVNVNLPFWTRNMLKYGDNFILNYGENKKGITHVKQLVNYDVERIERIQNGKPSVRFKDRITGSEFNSFEVVHFRLLGNDQYLPYGMSILQKVRRVVRMLIMAEDAMLTYRILRAGEKRVFKIDVGNIDEDDVDDYMAKVASSFKRTQQVNPNNGQIDYRFNILGNDEDFFIPVRNANVQTGIDTLQGASNLSEIADLEYLRDLLFTGLGVPKPFLSFQDASGGGKNMAQFDIRFAKKIVRVQQAMIMELNKMAMIHLYLMGYRNEDLSDFTLTLNNPSTQQELLKTELLEKKGNAYNVLTRAENGIPFVSHTLAKKMLLNFSDREIVEDYKRIKMERVVMQELQDAPVVIKKTGLFNDIDKKYGEPMEGMSLDQLSGQTNQETGGAPSPIEGLPNQTPSELPPIEVPGGEQGGVPELQENYDDSIDKLMEIGSTKKQKKPTKKIITENNSKVKQLNIDAENSINEINKLIQETEDKLSKELK
jgi:hypothetical protein